MTSPAVDTGQLVVRPAGDTGQVAITPAVWNAVVHLRLPTRPPGSPTRAMHTATAAWLMARRSQNTRRAYLRDLTDYLDWMHEIGMEALHVRRMHVDGYLAMLRERDPAPSVASVNRKLSAVSSWYGYLIDADLATRNPVTAVDRPPVDRDFSPTTGLTVAETRALLRAADTTVSTCPSSRRLCALRNRALVGVLAALGLRVGEALALDDLDHNSGHRTLVVRGKGGRRRQLPIPPWLNTQLQAYLDARRRRVALHSAATDVELWEQALDPGLADADFAHIPLTGPLFVTVYHEIQHERRLRQSYVYELVQRLARQAGLAAADRISPHSLRHSAATAALDDGAPLRDVQDFLGHADPRTTRRYDRNRGSLDRSPAHRLGTLYAQ